jgi:regulatory protein YycH of two-component signal transduction system YycFG
VSGLHSTNNKTIATKHKIQPAKKKTKGTVTPSKKFLKK